jgi:hypothetical protein
MIDKALGSVFKVVTEEVSANPAFGKRMEEALAKFAVDYVDRQRAERRIGEFHPLVEFRKGTPEEFEARLAGFDATELRIIIQKHHLDPANTLKGKASKKALAARIAEAARKRSERDAKLFEY